jgi:hypothetical protein
MLSNLIIVRFLLKFFLFSGRPKLFFIESCRGGKAQRLHEVDDADDIVPQRDVDMADEIIYIPSDANTLLAYSSTKG